VPYVFGISRLRRTDDGLASPPVISGHESQMRVKTERCSFSIFSLCAPVAIVGCAAPPAFDVAVLPPSTALAIDFIQKAQR
jgi:hypothetical protein